VKDLCGALIVKLLLIKAESFTNEVFLTLSALITLVAL
jgi:hypothetical protein